jgi:DNA repair exonuclease SbcCD ATPase subunit
MRISLLKVTNFQRIHDIEIEPGERSLLLIAGKNKQGKSSLLRAMSAALGGGKEKPDQPVRKGEDSAQIVVELDDGATIVTKTFSKDGKTSLRVVNQEFGKLSSPQVALDKIVGARFLDPLAFTRLTAKGQREKLLEVVDIGIDLNAYTRERKKVFDERTNVNRDVKRLTAELGGLPGAVAELPTRMDMQSLIKKHADLLTQVGHASDARRAIDQNSGKLSNAEAQVKDLEARLVEAKTGLGHLRAYASEEEERLSPLADVDVSAEIESVSAEMSACDSHNSNVAKLEADKAATDSVQAKLSESSAEAVELTDRLKAYDDKKNKALAAAEMPVPNLDISEDAVLFNEVPLSQASGAEQLQISLAIASATSPQLRDIWLEDGALLDEDSLALVSKFAAENDLRVWLERVGESDDDCIIIEEGEVKS